MAIAPATETVTFASDGTQLGGYLARPDGAGPFPGVVVIHEIFGLNDDIRSVARRFADVGYVALAVDLFAGGNRAVCMARVVGGGFVNPLENRGVRGLKAALTALAGRPEVDETRLGAIGFCLGGGFAIAWACADDRLKAIAPYYGTNPRPFDAVARLCPVVGSYPGKDFTTRAGKKLDIALDGYDIPHDIKVYPEARHSFFNSQSSRYDAAAAEDSWTRVRAFFDERVRGQRRF